MEKYLNEFLKFIDKKTYWKQDNDVTNSQIITAFLDKDIRLPKCKISAPDHCNAPKDEPSCYNTCDYYFPTKK